MKSRIKWLAKRWFRLLCRPAMLLCLMGAPAFAATVTNLYEGSAPADRGHDAALQEALRIVTVRASGRRDAPDRLGAALNNPRQYMRFESTNGGLVTAGFDSVSVDKLLTDAGLPIWGKERPATLVWLQIQEPDGAARWVTSDFPSPERDAIGAVAQQRGLPLVWPRTDLQEQAQMSTLTRESIGQLLAEAAAYGANAVLYGRARRDMAGGFNVQWTLASSESNADASGDLAEGVHLAADTFARIYAASGSTLANVSIEVSGLANLDAYAQTLNYLEGLTLVRTVALEEVAGDIMRFRLVVRGDADTLRRAIALGDLLAAASDAQAGAGRLAFRYQR